MRALILLTSLSLFLASYSLAIEPPATEQIEAPHYDFNGIWNYRSTNKLFSGGYRSNLLNGDFRILMENKKRRTLQLEGGNYVVLAEPGWLNTMLPTPAIIRNRAKRFDFPLWVGKKWLGELNFRGWKSINRGVTGIERVTTPAGTFIAYKIETDTINFFRQFNFYRSEIFYYSPETKSVVKFDFRLNMKDLVGDPEYGLYETVNIELTNFKMESNTNASKD